MSIRRFTIEPLLPLLRDGFTLLAPNNRSVDGILREFSRTFQNNEGTAEPGVISWVRPAVFAIDIYIQQLWQLASSHGLLPFADTQILSRFEEQEVWLQVVESGFDRYPLLNSEDTAASVSRSYRAFQQWDVPASGAVEHYRGAIDFQTFLSWREQFQAHCRKLQSVSLSDAGRIIAEHIGGLEAILPNKIALINFNQPPPLYARLFDSLASICELERVLSSDAEPSFAALFTESENEYRRFPDVRSEIDACIDWCLHKAEQSREAHIGIIVDPNHSLEPVIEEALFRRSEASNRQVFNLSSVLNRYHSSETLADSQDFSAAMSLLALNREIINSENFCKMLQSPNLVGYSKEIQARLALEVVLRKNVAAEVRLPQLRSIMLKAERDHHCPILAKALLEFGELARHERARQPLRQWLGLFAKQLSVLGWPGDSASEHAQRLSQQWQQSMQRFAASSAVLGKMSIGAALVKLKTFIRQTNVNLNFDDRLQISMLDIEEAQDLEFDHAWLLSVDDRNWPQPINPVAFIPCGLQHELSMPGSSNQQQLDLALTQLAVLRQKIHNELVVSNHQLEDELSIRPSSLLKNMGLTAPLPTEPDERDTAEAYSRPNLERHEQALHIPLRSDEEVSGGTSLLSNQSNCPFRAFARNRLQAKGLEDFSYGLDSIVRGNALHKALEYFGNEIADSKKMHSLSAKDTEELLARCAEVAIEYLRRLHPETMTPAFSLLEAERLTALLSGFLQFEKQRSEFTILSNEEDALWRHSRLSLKFRIDRIDRLADGTIALIDYKTGKFTNYKWFDERPDDLQLPLYQIAVSHNNENRVSATLIAQLNAENIGMISPMEVADFGAKLKVSGQARFFEGDWGVLQDTWNRRIHALVEEFESGLTAVAPTRGNQTCQYCDLSPLCRIADSELNRSASQQVEP